MQIYQFLASHRFSRYLKLSLLLQDLLLLNVSYMLSIYLRFGNMEKINNMEVQTLWLISNVLWILLTTHLDSYKLIRVERIERILTRTAQIIVVHLLIIAVFIVILKYGDISRMRLLYFYVLFFVFAFVFRILTIRFLKRFRANGHNFRTVVIVGLNEAGLQMESLLLKDLTFGFRVLGFFDNTPDPKLSQEVNYLGNLSEIEAFYKGIRIDEIIVAINDTRTAEIDSLILFCERNMIRLKFIPDFRLYTKSRKVSVEFYGSMPVLMFRKEPLESPLNRILKKFLDKVFALLIIVLVFPWLFPILIAAIKLSSKGPVFFKQFRSGEDNRTFTCFKFRTMRVNSLADELQATKGDARITKIGAFMRKTNLDEFPQFFNVLWGSMSVVGPRPHMLKHTEEYSNLINNYLVRHFAKPGITGWAQVNGFRGETKTLVEMEKRVEYDIWYIENWSIMLDVKIIWLTFFNMIRGDKNAF